MSIDARPPSPLPTRTHSAAIIKQRSAYGSSVRPLSVSCTERVVRRKSGTPSWSSSCLMRWPKAAGVSATERAARRKLRSFAAAAKQRRDSREGSMEGNE
jgi:hypothetical protein